MVCIPCIVIPVLLWIYKRFLEPILYPFISPIISRFWTKKAVQENGTDAPTANEKCNGVCETECNGNVSSSTTNGPITASDKKMD
ncbi:hypothetical protein AAFF_G00368670 [Aldrovandia affinis]|uniref:CR032 protein n=1 Tax=Aldrovandia affinis TaxID=143900 RepID=A0AAD7SHC0_9TELE|nr:hypothetical protein AAFF_G00368670 [Aldrovandia affinis]